MFAHLRDVTKTQEKNAVISYKSVIVVQSK